MTPKPNPHQSRKFLFFGRENFHSHLFPSPFRPVFPSFVASFFINYKCYFIMNVGVLEHYFGQSSVSAKSPSNDLDDLIWIAVQILECSHPPHTSFEEIMAAAARVRGQRSNATDSSLSIALPPSTSPTVRQKLKELALALNPVPSNSEVAALAFGMSTQYIPAQSAMTDRSTPTAQAGSRKETLSELAAEENPETENVIWDGILEDSDEESGPFSCRAKLINRSRVPPCSLASKTFRAPLKPGSVGSSHLARSKIFFQRGIRPLRCFKHSYPRCSADP